VIPGEAGAGDPYGVLEDTEELMVVAAAALALLMAQEPDLTSPGSRDLTLKVGKDDRAFRLHVPSGATTVPRPLVLALHGAASNGKQTETLTGLSPLADKKGFVVAYPDGENRIWRYWNVGEGRKDFQFISDLMDALVKSGTADPQRIYLTGISNGAYFSHALAVEYGDRVAAIAPVAGTLLKPVARTAKPKRAVPVCAWHGTEDTVVGFDGTDFISKRDFSLGAEDAAKWWAEKNGCAKEPAIEKLENRAPEDGTTVERWTFAGAAPVVFYKITGGGHTWPGMPAGGEKLLGKVCRDVDASEILWEFFSKHALPDKSK
jgi:polyhydroxybutyrate depolymerase